MSGRLAVGLTFVLWAIIPIIDKLALAGRQAPPAGVVARLLVAVVALLPGLACSPTLREGLAELGCREWLAFGASGIISLLLAQYCYYVALRDRAVATLFPFLFGGAPVLTMGLAWAILGEPIGWRAGLGGGLIFLGSLLLFW